MELPDDEPRAQLNFNGEDHVMHRYNSGLFMHLGDLAMYDHIFVSYDEDNCEGTGAYIFRQNNAFQPLVEYMNENEFTMHLNLTEVAECDRDAFDNSVKRELGDINHVPDDWDL